MNLNLARGVSAPGAGAPGLFNQRSNPNLHGGLQSQRSYGELSAQNSMHGGSQFGATGGMRMQQSFQRTGASGGFNFGPGQVFTAMAARANTSGFLGGGSAGHGLGDAQLP